jgi:hypothetical protein
MEITNQKRSKTILRIFNFTGILVVITCLIFLWLKNDTGLLIGIGVFLGLLAFSQLINFIYLEFRIDKGQVVIRYYPVISIFKKQYQSIEFAQTALHHYKIERMMGFSDLILTIKTRRGIAEYPAISLTAMRKSEVAQINEALLQILNQNRENKRQ